MLKIPVRQRAKFEGWLKFELAYLLEKTGKEKVEVEYFNQSTSTRSDIKFESDMQCYEIELKTPNSSWRMPRITAKIRPVTKNIDSIIHDTVKLRTNKNSIGIVAFVLFPLSMKDEEWKFYLNRISSEAKIHMQDMHYEKVQLLIEDNNDVELLVCAYQV